MHQQQADLSDLWTQHQRRNSKTTQSWACVFCSDRKIFINTNDLCNHAIETHADSLSVVEKRPAVARAEFRAEFESNCLRKRSVKDEPSQKRPLSNPAPVAPCRSMSELKTLTLGGTQEENEDVVERDKADEVPDEHPRKRAAVGDGISAGSASPLPFRDSESPPPRRSKARPTSAPYGSRSTLDTYMQQRTPFDDIPRPRAEKRPLWTDGQDAPLTRAPFGPSNTARSQIQRSSNLALQNKSRKQPNQSPQQTQLQPQSAPNPIPSAIFGRASPSAQAQTKDDAFDIVLQPETRPISQEQLVAEVKGIYAGLVMVEAKCIEVDNKQATLASADPGAQPKLNNEQWQALIALHRTLLHEHHDFFLASQHPSASPALRRLASKYAMPARMWRHSIHSFLELLRHRLPASLDHMLAFIYLAYSMMALLYETVPAFEDTWIESLGDLGRYKMAIEDDDIRDRDVWTGVARHWYSKASDKAPTTGRLYHHLAILARPNALQQLFYYSKSLCVAVPFTSARESILTLFDPVINAENSQGQYRLPPLDTAFVKAHGLLFTSRGPERFDLATQDFPGLLDNQIGRITRKFMEQGSQSPGSYSKAAAFWRAHYLMCNTHNPTLSSLLYDSLRHSERLYENTNLASECSTWLRNLSAKMKLNRNEYIFVSKFLSSVPSEYVLGSLQDGSLQSSTDLQSACHCDLDSGQRVDPRHDLQSRVGTKENLSTLHAWPGNMNDPDVIPPNLAPALAANIATEHFPASISALPAAVAEARSQLLVEEDCCRLCMSQTLRSWRLQDCLTTGMNVGRKLLGFLSRLDPALKALAFGILLQSVDALPIHPPPSYAGVCEEHRIDLWNEPLGKDIVPLVKGSIKCVILIASSHAMLRYADPGGPTNFPEDTVEDSPNNMPKESGVLLMFIGASILGTCYLGIDERVSNYDFALVCASSAVPICRRISKKLAPFEKTAAATGTTITLVAVSFVEAFRELSSPFYGKYEHAWAFHLFGVLPALMLVGWLWEAFVLNLGFAQRFENVFLHLQNSPLQSVGGKGGVPNDIRDDILSRGD